MCKYLRGALQHMHACEGCVYLARVSASKARHEDNVMRQRFIEAQARAVGCRAAVPGDDSCARTHLSTSNCTSLTEPMWSPVSTALQGCIQRNPSSPATVGNTLRDLLCRSGDCWSSPACSTGLTCAQRYDKGQVVEQKQSDTLQTGTLRCCQVWRVQWVLTTTSGRIKSTMC